MMRRNLISAFWSTGVLVLLLHTGACKSVPGTKSIDGPAADSLAAGAFSRDTLDIWEKYNVAERQGKRAYDRYCAVCHGVAGGGDGFNSYNLDPRPRSLADSTYMHAISDATLAETISRGGRGVNKSVLMPAYQSTLRPEQIQSLVTYIRTFARPRTSR